MYCDLYFRHENRLLKLSLNLIAPLGLEEVFLTALNHQLF